MAVILQGLTSAAVECYILLEWRVTVQINSDIACTLRQSRYLASYTQGLCSITGPLRLHHCISTCMFLSVQSLAKE